MNRLFLAPLAATALLGSYAIGKYWARIVNRPPIIDVSLGDLSCGDHICKTEAEYSEMCYVQGGDPTIDATTKEFRCRLRDLFPEGEIKKKGTPLPLIDITCTPSVALDCNSEEDFATICRLQKGESISLPKVSDKKLFCLDTRSRIGGIVILK